MSQNVELKILTPMTDSITGEPMPNISLTLANELGLKNEIDIKNNRDKIPNMTFADVFNSLFDVVSLPSNTIFALYDNILRDIRDAKKQDKDSITISIAELEQIKKLMDHGVPNSPEFNRKISFVFDVLNTSSIVVEESIPPNGELRITT